MQQQQPVDSFAGHRVAGDYLAFAYTPTPTKAPVANTSVLTSWQIHANGFSTTPVVPVDDGPALRAYADGMPIYNSLEMQIRKLPVLKAGNLRGAMH